VGVGVSGVVGGGVGVEGAGVGVAGAGVGVDGAGVDGAGVGVSSPPQAVATNIITAKMATAPMTDWVRLNRLARAHLKTLLISPSFMMLTIVLCEYLYQIFQCRL
jgi:hypothetical protein